jgi:hypothetical protein
MRRAATHLRELHGAATSAPWRVSYINGTSPAVDGPGKPDGHLVAEMYRCPDRAHAGREGHDAELIVALRNSSESLAAWLEAEAVTCERMTVTDQYGRSRWCHQCGGSHGRNCACWDGALATARAILGEDGQ